VALHCQDALLKMAKLSDNRATWQINSKSFHTGLCYNQRAYLYGRCLCPLKSASRTVPRADRLSAVPSLLLLRLQLPRSSRWRRLRPPATAQFTRINTTRLHFFKWPSYRGHHRLVRSWKYHLEIKSLAHSWSRIWQAWSTLSKNWNANRLHRQLMPHFNYFV